MSSGPVGDFDLKGKIVLITGGGSGIGLSFVKLCHSKGARILIGDLKLTSEGEEFTNSIPKNSISFTKCDVTDFKALRDLVSTSVKVFGEVPDVYCPCAGIFEPTWSNFWDDTEEDEYKTMKINAEHPIKLTRLAFRALIGANKKGVVILVASGAGLYGQYLAALYCASKHAVVGLAKSLGPADEEEGVKVVCICPGVVTTPLWYARDDDKAKVFKYEDENTPTNTPDEIAQSMMNLVEKGEHMGGTVMSRLQSGEIVEVEGGPQKYSFGNEFVQKKLAKERSVEWKL